MLFLLALLFVSNSALAQPESVIEPITQELILSETVPSGSYLDQYSVNTDDHGKIVGFSVTNEGVNRIIPKPSEIGAGPDRTFAFDMPDRARQGILLRVTDVPSDKLSEMMESYFTIFPRLVVPAIKVVENKIIVTLPNREEMILSADSKEIIDGVFKEGAPIDLGPDRFKRKFADLSYTGKGLVLRADRRGEDPRIGAQRIAIATYQGKTCKIPVTKLWEQNDAVHFLFHSDADFFAFIKANCGFSIGL
jgi:hypothetical protein